MKHFNEAAWADFARDLVSPDTQAAMHEHAAACATCRSTLRIWQEVFSLTKNESQFTPPDDVLRVVKSQFMGASTPGKSRVRLVFDSLLQPAMAGLRGAASDRQLLFETDEFYIDLRLEAPRDAARTRLVGQILNRGNDERSTRGTIVYLREGQVPVASTMTNHFGEFQLEFESAPGLNVRIGGSDDQPIILPLELNPAPRIPLQHDDLA
jgi:hypothetical protein